VKAVPGEPFSSADVEARVAAAFDAGPARIRRHRALVTGEGLIDGRKVAVVATDPAQLRGAIGIVEAGALTQSFAQARASGTPMVLMLDSSGARVDEDLPALGAFRELFREALGARLENVPMFALLGAACFGGASLLACICGRRSYLPGTLLAASGPRVIEASQGAERFDARDTQAVAALLGSAARRAWHPQDRERTDTLAATSATLREWIQIADPALDLEQAQARLARRLASAQPSADAAYASVPGPSSLAALLPPGYTAQFSGRLAYSLPATAGKPVFVGALGGSPLDAADSIGLSGQLLQLRVSHPGSPVVLLLDASAHAASLRDERLLLSDFLVHLSLVIASLKHAGHRVALWIVGRASGASYVAFAAAAESVSAAVDARIEILPAQARASIIGTRAGADVHAHGWLAARVADAILEQRLRLQSDQSSG
jgi:hypothetical protein